MNAEFWAQLRKHFELRVGESQLRPETENADVSSMAEAARLDSPAQSLCGEFSELLSDPEFEKRAKAL
jgi:hypothetical protein